MSEVDPKNPFADLDALRRATSGAEEHRRKKAQYEREMRPGFTVLNAAWSDALERINPTFSVARRLAHLCRKYKGAPTVIGNKWLSHHGVGRKAKTRALAKLEAAGLIRVDKRPNRSPEVIFLVRPDTK